MKIAPFYAKCMKIILRPYQEHYRVEKEKEPEKWSQALESK